MLTTDHLVAHRHGQKRNTHPRHTGRNGKDGLSAGPLCVEQGGSAYALARNSLLGGRNVTYKSKCIEDCLVRSPKRTCMQSYCTLSLQCDLRQINYAKSSFENILCGNDIASGPTNLSALTECRRGPRGGHQRRAWSTPRSNLCASQLRNARFFANFWPRNYCIPLPQHFEGSVHDIK